MMHGVSLKMLKTFILETLYCCRLNNEFNLFCVSGPYPINLIMNLNDGVTKDDKCKGTKFYFYGTS